MPRKPISAHASDAATPVDHSRSSSLLPPPYLADGARGLSPRLFWREARSPHVDVDVTANTPSQPTQQPQSATTGASEQRLQTEAELEKIARHAALSDSEILQLRAALNISPKNPKGVSPTEVRRPAKQETGPNIRAAATAVKDAAKDATVTGPTLRPEGAAQAPQEDELACLRQAATEMGRALVREQSACAQLREEKGRLEGIRAWGMDSAALHSMLWETEAALQLVRNTVSQSELLAAENAQLEHQVRDAQPQWEELLQADCSGLGVGPGTFAPRPARSLTASEYAETAAGKPRCMLDVLALAHPTARRRG